MVDASFSQALCGAYLRNPCQVLPNALWKTLAVPEPLHEVARCSAGQVVHIELHDERHLYTYWRQDRSRADFSHLDLQAFNLALIHQDFLSAFPAALFHPPTAYFRLVHKHTLPVPHAPAGRFRVEEVSTGQEERVVSFISRCYADLHPTMEEVGSWMQHAVYDPALWVWVIDGDANLPAGLGIAEFDPSIKEGSLEWVQVLPEYRGQGVGRQVVYALLARLQGRAAFSTVSGMAQPSGVSAAEHLYRRCGFTGSDVWWAFRK